MRNSNCNTQAPPLPRRQRQWVSQYEFSNHPSLTTQFNAPASSVFHTTTTNDTTRTIATRITKLVTKKKAIMYSSLVLVLYVTLQFFGKSGTQQLQSYTTAILSDNDNRNTDTNSESLTKAQQRSLRDCTKQEPQSDIVLPNEEASSRLLKEDGGDDGGCHDSNLSPNVTPSQASILLSKQHKGGVGHYMDGTYAEPTYITLCKELVQRNEDAKLIQEVEETQQNAQAAGQTEKQKAAVNPFFNPMNKMRKHGTLYVHEHYAMCSDWAHPHSALLNLVASSVVAYVGKRFGIHYEHNCHTTIADNAYYTQSKYDSTTIQQIFPQLSMPIDESKASLGDVVLQCQQCLQLEEKQQLQENHKKGYLVPEDTHHCLVFPNVGTSVKKTTVRNVSTGEISEEVLDDQGQVVHTILDAVLSLVKSRLYHTSIDWSFKAHIPGFDPRSGVVIFIDAMQALPIPFQLYQQHIAQDVTHVSILSSPSCIDDTSGRAGGMECMKYSMELKQYLTNHYQARNVQVSFELIASTAAAYSRMILAHTLICPPGSTVCLIPALAKDLDKSAVIFEHSTVQSTFHWFTYLMGDHDQLNMNNIQVIPVEANTNSIDMEQRSIENQFQSFHVSDIMKIDEIDAAAGTNTQEKLFNEEEGFVAVQQRAGTGKDIPNDIKPRIGGMDNGSSDAKFYKKNNVEKVVVEGQQEGLMNEEENIALEEPPLEIEFPENERFDDTSTSDASSTTTTTDEPELKKEKVMKKGEIQFFKDVKKTPNKNTKDEENSALFGGD